MQVASITLLRFALTAPSPVTRPTSISTPHLAAPAIHRHELANGLRVVVLPDRSLPLVAANLWYHVGSKHERPGRTGFAHLFEHMLFQGSEHVGTNDHFRYIQQVGGVANGSTWYDRTNYYETLPSSCLDLALWLESDRMGFLLPALTPEKLENQRSVVMNERRQRVDNQPYGQAFERLFALLFPPEHPYSWPVIGWMDDIAAATLDEVRAFFSTYYSPNNAVLSLAGDLEVDAALTAVEHWFGGLPRGPELAWQRPSCSPLAARTADEISDRVQLPRVYLAAITPPYGSAEWFAGSLLSSLLTAGKSSLLYHDLVYRRRLAQDVSSYLFPTEEVGVLVVTATARPGVELTAVSAALDEHLARLAADLVGDADWERATNGLLHAYYGELQSLERRADLLSACTTLFDDPLEAWREPERYAAIDREGLRAFARRFATSERWAELRVVPAERSS